MSDEPKPPTSSASTTSPSAKLPDANKKSTPSLPPDAISRKESKAAQLFRSFLRWAGVALLVFGLGALTTIFLFYVPKSNELKLVQQDLATANTTITTLQTEITSLEARIRTLSALEETNLALQTDFSQAQIHIHLLTALADIRAAQAALAKDDAAAAATELTGTTATLTAMQSLLEGDPVEVANTLLSRLKLAQGELDSNPFAAQSDLEVLATGLLQLEQSLFAVP